MKRFIHIVALLGAFMSLPLLAQDRDVKPESLPELIPHLQFMGMPIEGAPAAFVEGLKQKGFNYVERKGAVYILTGSFAGQSGCAVGLNTKENFIWKVSVSFPCQLSWPAVKAQYDKYKGSYTSKYQVQPECVEKLSSRFREGTGQEQWGFEDESSRWQSTFYLEDGFIVLAVRYNRSQSNMFLVVEYVDKFNFLIKEQIDMEDI